MQSFPKNRVDLSFGQEESSYGGLRIDLDVKMDVNIKKSVPNLKPTDQPFAIQLRLKTKKGEAENIAKTLEKLLNPEKRFRPIPQVFYYAIKKKHIAVGVSHKDDEVILDLEPYDKFFPVATSFFQTFKQYGFQRVAEEGFDIRIKFESSRSPLDLIKQHIDVFKHLGLVWFRSVLDNSHVELTYDKDIKATGVIDGFLDLALESQRHIPSFSFFEDVEIEASFDFDHLDSSRGATQNNLFAGLHSFCEKCIEILGNYDDKEVKQMIKLKELLQSKIDDRIQFRFYVPEIGLGETTISGQNLMEIFEFFLMHPSTKELGKVESYYEKWLLFKQNEQ